MTIETYNLINFIVQTVIGIAIIATFIIYFLQLQTMRNSSIGQNTVSIINFIQDPEVRKARTHVIKVLSNKKYNEWTENDKYLASIVCSNYNTLSVLITEKGYIENIVFIDNWGISIIKCFNILKPHITEMQRPEKSGKTYWDYFGLLYKECLLFHEYEAH